MRTRLILLGLLLLIAVASVEAQRRLLSFRIRRPAAASCDRTAASASLANVQTQVNAATNGQTVCVPGGSASWAGSLTWTGKGLTLRGAGIGVTTITVPSTTRIIALEASGAYAINRITGFTFDGGNITQDSNEAIIIIDAVGDGYRSLRVDHNTFSNIGKRAVWGYMNGYDVSWVVDHNTFSVPGSNSAQSITIEGGRNVGGALDSSGTSVNHVFTRAYNIGLDRGLFVEDNAFDFASTNNDASMEGYLGAKYVYRHNTVTNVYLATNHGTDSGGGERGMASIEIYENTQNVTANLSRIANWRGGTGMIWGNASTTSGAGSYSGNLQTQIYRSCTSYAPYGICDGSSAWDENTSGQQGYACLDSAGHYFGAFGAQSGASQLKPMYGWLNTLNGSRIDIAIDNNPQSVGGCTRGDVFHTILNRDLYNQGASFTGATGVGVGLLSARPSTCTPNVGYWATDTRTFYQCSSTNTWTTYYTPYTYPHPLTATP